MNSVDVGSKSEWEANSTLFTAARTMLPQALLELRAARERIGKLEKVLRDLIVGISVHNNRLSPGQLATKIEGPVVSAACAALQEAT